MHISNVRASVSLKKNNCHGEIFPSLTISAKEDNWLKRIMGDINEKRCC